MDIGTLVRGVAYLALAAALFASAIALSDRQHAPATTTEAKPSSTKNLDSELARCKTLGIQAAGDDACKAVWQADRERFLRANELYRDRITDTVPATTNAKEPASTLGGGWPERATVAPGENAGQRR
ncbi:MAG TPA: putative entry exclusion protein TrbK-alt [Xanthobacteraceae bacterium]|jgi:conjugative transfer region protein TrbK